MCGMGEGLRFLRITTVGGLPTVKGRFSVSEEEMVGTTGFEPATSRTPSVRATRLRYVPTGKLTATAKKPGAESEEESAPPRYHHRPSSVKKARRASRISSSILRLS